MKILHVIPSADLSMGGPSRALLDAAQALTQNGVENTILTLGANPGVFEEPNTPRRVVFPASVGKRWGFSLMLRTWIESHVSEFDIVDIHSFFSYSTWCAAREAVKQQIPYVLRTAGALDDFSFGQKQLKKQLFLNFVGRRIVTEAKIVQCTSHFEERQVLARIPGAKTRVVYLGTYLFADERAPRQSGSPLTVIYLGRLYPHKGIELLIEAVSELAKRKKEVKLILAGSGASAYEDHLRNLARDSNVEGQITWTGFVNLETKKSWLRKADLFALPSEHENFGISAVEAMAMGLPVIVSDQVGVADEIKMANSGLIIQRSTAQLASAIEHFLNNPNDLFLIGDNAKKLVENKFRWPKIADQLIALYESTLKTA